MTGNTCRHTALFIQDDIIHTLVAKPTHDARSTERFPSRLWLLSLQER